MKHTKEIKKIDKGITLISLVITIAVMIIVASISISISYDRFELNNYNKMKNDIELLQDKVSNYYLKYIGLPTLKDDTGSEILYPNEKLTFNKNINDNDIYYVLDLNAMEGIAIEYGKEGFETIRKTKSIDIDKDVDVYIINEKTYQIYYVQGIKMDEVMYHTNSFNENNTVSNVPPTKPKIKVVSGEKDIDDEYYTNIQLEFVPGLDKASEIVQTTYSVNNGIEENINKLTNNIYEILIDGTHEIKVKSYDNEGNYKETTQTFIKKTINIELDKTAINKESGIGSFTTENLIATVTNVEGDLIWKSSDVEVASINGDGNTRTIELRNAGTAEITVAYGSISKKCSITVTDIVPKIAVNEKADKHSTIDGLMYSATNPVIPKGFMAKDTTTSNWKETNTYKNGLVISDGINEFVWIPVENLNQFARLKEGSTTNYRAVLYSFISTQPYLERDSSADIREPDIVQEFDSDYISSFGCAESLDDDTDIDIDDVKILLQQNFNKMVESVDKYKGFYVGRYEMSFNGIMAQSKAGEISANAASTDTKRWYGLYQKAKTYSSLNLSLGVKSEMIWGCQWDAMIKWMINNNINIRSSKPTDTARGIVASSNTTNITGAQDSNDILNNVYDLIGNRRDWLQTISGTKCRVFEGGCDENRALSGDYYGYPTVNSENYGTRLSLYVKVE